MIEREQERERERGMDTRRRWRLERNLGRKRENVC